MKTNRLFWKHAALGVLLAAGAAALLARAAEKTSRPDPLRGKRLYYEQGCYGCHGFNGETGVRRLVGSPLLVRPETFIAYLRLRGDQQPLAPSTRMPRFPASALSDADALDIYAYVRTFKLHAPDPKGIEALQKIVESAQGEAK